MNLPNKLTVFRVILIIPFVLVMLGSHAQWGWFMALFGGIADYADLIALMIFVIASLTDMLDGKIARKYIWSLILESLWILWRISCSCALR